MRRLMIALSLGVLASSAWWLLEREGAHHNPVERGHSAVVEPIAGAERLADVDDEPASAVIPAGADSIDRVHSATTPGDRQRARLVAAIAQVEARRERAAAGGAAAPTLEMLGRHIERLTAQLTQLEDGAAAGPVAFDGGP